MDFALSPMFSTNKYFYVSYTVEESEVSHGTWGRGRGRVSRGLDYDHGCIPERGGELSADGDASGGLARYPRRSRQSIRLFIRWFVCKFIHLFVASWYIFALLTFNTL